MIPNLLGMINEWGGYTGGGALIVLYGNCQGQVTTIVAGCGEP